MKRLATTMAFTTVIAVGGIAAASAALAAEPSAPTGPAARNQEPCPWFASWLPGCSEPAEPATSTPATPSVTIQSATLGDLSYIDDNGKQHGWVVDVGVTFTCKAGTKVLLHGQAEWTDGSGRVHGSLNSVRGIACTGSPQTQTLRLDGHPKRVEDPGYSWIRGEQAEFQVTLHDLPAENEQARATKSLNIA